MKVSCQYSGIVYDVTGFGGTKLEYIHPVFSAGPKWLLSRMGTWAAQKFTEEESRLLFLGLLHSTELVKFQATAVPDNTTVQLNMEQLARFVSWSCGITRPHMVLPSFVIQKDNKKLNNVRYWIQAWLEARKAFEDGYKAQGELRSIRDKEAVLERLIRTSTKQTEDYAGLLSTWALQATGVPKALHQYWRELFCLKGIDVYNAKTADLEELVEHMEEYLEHGSIFAHSALKHCRTLLKKNRAGLTYGLGISDEDLDEISKNPFTIVEGSVEDQNMAIIAANAPSEEPQPQQYESRVAYLRARAAWTIAQRAKEYAAELETGIEDAMQEDALDHIAAEEEEGTEIDGNSLSIDGIEQQDLGDGDDNG